MELQRRFAGSRPEDVQIRDVSCLGRCERAPAISINDQILTEVSAASAAQMARRALRGDEVDQPHAEQARIACKADLYGDGDDHSYGLVRKLVGSRVWDAVLEQVKGADLRGMG